MSITVRFCFRDDLRVMIQENAADALKYQAEEIILNELIYG